MSGFFENGNEVRLIRRSGEIVRRWSARFSEHFPDADHLDSPPASDYNVDLHGVVINPDGSVVFNYEYSGTVKLSYCGDVIWTLAERSHHSVERSELGGYWIPGDRKLSGPELIQFAPFNALTPNYGYDNSLLHVSEDGEVLERIRLSKMLYDNGLEALLTANGHIIGNGDPWDTEFVHLNKITELPQALDAAFPMFEAGDLMLSFRTYNLIMIVDPEDWRVKWQQTGPWLRQHDPEFSADGRITVFNNNTYATDLGEYGRTSPNTSRMSNVISIDPKTRETEVVVGERIGQEMLTVIRGKHDPLTNGGFIVTEFEAGRIIEFAKDGTIVWEYINRYDEDFVLELTEGRIYTAGYFEDLPTSCN